MSKDEEEIARLKNALAETNKLLEDIQWHSRHEDGYECCPDCGAMTPDGYHKVEGHTEYCDLIKALERNTKLLGGGVVKE